MNFIRHIREIINDNCQVVKIALWSNEMAVYLWESEIGISVFPETGKVIFDVEGFNYQLDCGQMNIISRVMTVLLDNMEEIKQLTKETR